MRGRIFLYRDRKILVHFRVKQEIMRNLLGQNNSMSVENKYFERQQKRFFSVRS